MIFLLGHVSMQRQIDEILHGKPRLWRPVRRRHTVCGVVNHPLPAIRPPRGARRTSRPLSAFLSYKWGTDTEGRSNNSRVERLALLLKAHGVCTWYDGHSMEGHHMVQSMCNGIDCCHAMIVCVTRAYIESCEATAQSNCRLEMDYAHMRDVENRKMIPVVMEGACTDTATWKGPVGAYLGQKKYIDMSSDKVMMCNIDALVDAIRLAVA